MTVDVYELYHQAQKHLADRDAAAAIPLLELAAEQLQGDRAVLRLLALAYFDTSAFAAAESTLRVLVDQDPLDADALHMLGQALERSGRSREAGAISAWPPVSTPPTRRAARPGVAEVSQYQPAWSPERPVRTVGGIRFAVG